MIFREVSARLFPWDFVDEGADNILDVLERDTLCNSIHVAFMLHHEKRPLAEFYYPHNPRRKVYWTEDSRAYWHFDPGFYRDSRIKPALTENPELRGTDWGRFSVDLARRRGMLIGAHLSHTWIDKARAVAEYSDCLQRTITGKVVPGVMCVNSPDTRAYARAIFTELPTRYDVDFIQISLQGFMGAPSYREKLTEVQRLVRLPLGTCFCDNCRATAEAQGLNWNAIVDRVRWIADGHDRYNAKQAFELNLLLNSTATASQLFVEVPELHAWFKFRCDSYTRFWKDVYTAGHRAKPTLDVRFNDCWVYPEFHGFDLRGMSQYFDSIRGADYLEEIGTPEMMAVKRAFYHSIRRAVGLDKHFLTAISQRLKCTADLVKETILISAQCGADGTTIASYDTAPFDLLRAMRDGFEEAGITVARG